MNYGLGIRKGTLFNFVNCTGAAINSLHRLHMLVALTYFHSQGIGCSAINVKYSLGIGKGTVSNCVHHAAAEPTLFKAAEIFGLLLWSE
jgi:hypothetical protein